MTTAIVREEKEAGYYDAIYAKGYTTHQYEPVYKGILNCLKSYTAPKPRILELGCGLGDMAELLLDAGYAYRGFDFSAEAVRISQERVSSGDFFVGNVYDDEPYEGFDYNTVIAIEILEHVADLTVIEKIKPGCRVIASVPNYWDDSHLRVYADPKIDIVKRFQDLLHISRIGSISYAPNERGQIPTMYIFEAIRLHP